MKRPITIILCGSGWGAPDQRTALGPGAAYQYHNHFEEVLKDFDCNLVSTLYHCSDLIKAHKSFFLPQKDDAYHQLSHIFYHHSMLVKQAIENDRLPIILGGDHSIAMATWAGVKMALGDIDFGLLWLDAHMDAHTPETSPSQAPHGMPVAVLLGQGKPEWVNLGEKSPKIKPDRLALLGIRSFEEGEETFLKNEKVLVHTMNHIRQHGLVHCFKLCLERVRNEDGFFGLSVDIDVFDPKNAPGTGTIAPGGIHPDELFPLIKGLALNKQCLAIEIAEINVHKDIEDKTTQLIEDMIKTLLS